MSFASASVQCLLLLLSISTSSSCLSFSLADLLVECFSGTFFECCIVLQVEQVLTIARCSLNFVAVVFGKDLHCQLQSAHLHCLRRTAEHQTGRRPEHVARFDTCMGSAHEVRTRSFTQSLALEMIGCLIVASWSVDSKGLRLAPGKSLAKSAAVVARCAG